MRLWPVLATIIIMGSILGIAQPVTAADEWPDRCHDRMEQLGEGEYSGTLSPNDLDFLKLNLNKGDYATIRLSTTSQGEGNRIRFAVRSGSITDRDGGDITVDEGPDPILDEKNTAPYHMVYLFSGEVQFRVYSEQKDPICINLRTNGDHAGEWKMSMTFSEETPPAIGSESSDDSALQEQLQEKNSTISELRTTVEEQREQIEELQAKLEGSDGDEGVTINVEISPGNGQQSFIEGSTAVISAQSTNADLSQLEIQYAGAPYSVNEDGTAAIPLTAAGSQELVFEYMDITETVMITVDETGQADGDGDITVDTPGFGPIIAITAILILALIVRRLHEQS